jgi:hypothetical protein
LRDLDRALAGISEEQRRVLLLIGLGGHRMRKPRRSSTCRSGRSVRACSAAARRSASSWTGDLRGRWRGVWLSPAPCRRADGSSRKVSQFRIFRGCRRNRRSRYLSIRPSFRRSASRGKPTRSDAAPSRPDKTEIASSQHAGRLGGEVGVSLRDRPWASAGLCGASRATLQRFRRGCWARSENSR